MSGRRLRPDTDPVTHRYRDDGTAQRRRILRETIAAFEAARPPDRYHRLASANLERWRRESHREVAPLETHVLAGDWGDVAQGMTRTYGECFAVLNMANAYSPGGAYVEGAIAQEEDMFRRTDCHFRVGDDEYDAEVDEYRPQMTDLRRGRRVPHRRRVVPAAADPTRRGAGGGDDLPRMVAVLRAVRGGAVQPWGTPPPPALESWNPVMSL